MIHLLVLLALVFASGCRGPEHISPMDPMNPDNSIGFISVAEAKGKIWFGTTGGGILSFDGRSWKSYTTEDGLPGNWVFDVEPFGDELWLVIRDEGFPPLPQYYPEMMRKEVYKFSPHKGSVKGYEAPEPVLYLRGGDGNLFAMTRRYLGIYDPSSDEIGWIPVPSENGVMGSFWDEEGLWLIGVAIDGSMWEILNFDPSSQSWRSWKAKPPSTYHLGYEVALARDGGMIWVGAADGMLTAIDISSIPYEGAKTIELLPVPTIYSSLMKADILLDEERLWFCSSEGGIYLFPKGREGIGKSYNWVLKELPGSYPLCIHKSGKWLWIGTSKGSIRLDAEEGKAEVFRYPI